MPRSSVLTTRAVGLSVSSRAAGKFRAGRFDGVDDQEDRPLITQFCGNDPDTVVRAARHIEQKCDAVDLNLGCPQNIAKKGNYGAFLLPNPQLCEDIVSTMSRCVRTHSALPVCREPFETSAIFDNTASRASVTFLCRSDAVQRK